MANIKSISKSQFRNKTNNEQVHELTYRHIELMKSIERFTKLLDYKFYIDSTGKPDYSLKKQELIGTIADVNTGMRKLIQYMGQYQNLPELL